MTSFRELLTALHSEADVVFTRRSGEVIDVAGGGFKLFRLATVLVHIGPIVSAEFTFIDGLGGYFRLLVPLKQQQRRTQ